MPKTILIVDDEEDLVKVTTFRLKSLGYNVAAGVNGQEALDLIKEKRPDLVLLDLRLPVMDGRDVCKAVKANPELKDIPIVMFTASTEQISVQAKEAGADGFLVKPFEQEQLIAVLDKFLKGGP
ncbi:MAG: response regulator [Candidatus Omnitrophica bacterium]|jgi:CheY-like chemotaxis protein|nr:response regulator [Candidatus Omnitrophota bacterium]